MGPRAEGFECQGWSKEKRGRKLLDGFLGSWEACREKSKKGQSRGASEKLQGGRYQLSINKNFLMVSPSPTTEIILER